MKAARARGHACDRFVRVHATVQAVVSIHTYHHSNVGKKNETRVVRTIFKTNLKSTGKKRKPESG